MITNRQIYDLVTRIALLTECVKLYEGNQFSDAMRELKKAIRALIVGVQYPKMSDMTKTELTSLVLKASKEQGVVFADFTSGFNRFLYDFMNADVSMTKRAFATLFIRDIQGDAEPADDEEALEFFQYEDENSRRKPIFPWSTLHHKTVFPELWAKIGNGVIPANGMTLAQFIKAFTDSAQGAILNAIRAASVNDETPEEAANRIVGNEKTGESGIIDRVINQGRAVIDTALQHVSQSVSGAVASAVLEMYRWDSVMDSHTSTICRSRNGNVYVFGEGPMPPAHVKCRSHITPLNGSTDDTPRQTLYNWASSQSLAFQRAAFNGDGRTFADIRPMALEQFAQQTTVVLS